MTTVVVIAGGIVAISGALVILGRWATGSWRFYSQIVRLVEVPRRVDALETGLTKALQEVGDHFERVVSEQRQQSIELQAAQGRFTELVAAISVRTSNRPVLFVGAHGIIKDASEAAEELLKYPRGTLAGRVHDILIPEETRERHETWIGQYFKVPVSRRMAGRRVEIVCADGTHKAVWVGLEPLAAVRDDGAPIPMLVYLDEAP